MTENLKEQESADQPLALKQGQYDRLQKYERMGDSYEADRYSSSFRKLYLNRRNSGLKRLPGQVPTDRSNRQILEVGCGTGLSLDYLGKIYRSDSFTGVDISERMLEQARNKHQSLDRFRFFPRAPLSCHLLTGNSILYSTPA
jgi:SAM-dependent methyltransferase